MISFRIKAFYFTLGITLLTILGGCAGSRQQFVSTAPVNAWKLEGKIAVVYPPKDCNQNTCPKRSDQGKIQWQQVAKNYEITLSDPFGRRVMVLTGNDIRLVANAPGQSSVTTTPEAFISLLTQNKKQTALFADLRPQDLRYWVTGRSIPNVALTKQTEQSFEQKGFTVISQQWRETRVGYLPSLITISKGDLKFRLVIKEWDKIDD